MKSAYFAAFFCADLVDVPSAKLRGATYGG